jgi:hypothetical protein
MNYNLEQNAYSVYCVYAGNRELGFCYQHVILQAYTTYPMKTGLAHNYVIREFSNYGAANTLV